MNNTESYKTGFISKNDYIERIKQGLSPQTFGNIIGYPCNKDIKYPINLPNVDYYSKNTKSKILSI